MAGRWVEVVRLQFEGTRFRDRALDVDALAELAQFQRIVAETAKALWLANHPERQRLPRRFEARTRLCLRTIESGSAIAPLEVYLDEAEQPEFWGREPVEADDAISLAYDTLSAISKEANLPERFPRQLIAEYAKLGSALHEDEAIQICPPRKRPLPYTRAVRDNLVRLAETPHRDVVTLRGEVQAADVRAKQFRIWLNGGESVAGCFSEDQEEIVTTALRDHRSIRIRVTGVAEYSPDGILMKVVSVGSIQPVPLEQPGFDFAAPPIEDVLRGIASQVPESEWEELPKDLTSSLDHYIYGIPKA
jgi:hypothetical protein